MAQRVSGMGFALVVAPVLTLLVGPFDGVLLVNLCGAVSSSLVITRVWRDIDWRQYFLLAGPALVALVPGAIVSVLLGGPALQITVGAILIAALSVSLIVTRADRVVARLPAGILAGAASGFMSATAGIGGPGASVYSILTRWDHRSFAATVQPLFVTLGLASFTSKVLASPDGLPPYDWWLWVVVIGCTVVGLALGEVLAGRVSVRHAKLAVIAISYAGGVAAIVDGAFELLT